MSNNKEPLDKSIGEDLAISGTEHLIDGQKTFFGHPTGLFVCFMAEMWERFCYYGMRVLLTLYLIESLMAGDNKAFAIYGAYTALVYAAPVLGGRIADKILGYRLAIILGGILMAIGEFFILGGNETWLLVGMGTIIVGNGYFKANISSVVGRLYRDSDPRKDSGFTIFYIGINIGALLATTLVAEVGHIYGAHYGFGLAGLGMILGIVFFIGGQKHIRDFARPPHPEKLKNKIFGPLTLLQVTILASLAIIPVLYFLISKHAIVGWLLVAVAIYVMYVLLSTAFKSNIAQRDRIFLLIILMFVNVLFWALFEQAGTSLTMFAKRNVDRIIGGWEMGAATTQFFNPFFIILFGSIFSWMWVKLDKMKMNPNIPTKFGMGLVFLGFGYLIVLVGSTFGVAGMVPLWIIALLYMFHTVGELFLSPIGLSMVTKLAPKHMTGAVMGGWFLTFSGGNFLAGQIAQLTGSVEGEGIEEMTTEASLAMYTGVYTSLGYLAVGAGILLILISPWLKKLLHGVK